MKSSMGKLSVVAVICCGALFGTTVSFGQQTQKVSLPFVTTKYTQQHTIDVGDVPAHQIRVFEYTSACMGTMPR